MSKPGRLLLVDDYRLSRTAMARFFRFCGYEVHEAGTAEHAFDLVQSSSFDVLITDYRLRGRADGLEFLHRFDRLAPGKQKFLVTGADPNLTKPQAEAIGAKFFEKPVILENLLSAIEASAKR